jgi:SRSO17 transposase
VDRGPRPLRGGRNSADAEFATKPELAMQMLERARDSGVPARWVTVDEVYGQHSKLRAKAEELGLSYVLAVGVNQHVIAAACQPE